MGALAACFLVLGCKVERISKGQSEPQEHEPPQAPSREIQPDLHAEIPAPDPGKGKAEPKDEASDSPPQNETAQQPDPNPEPSPDSNDQTQEAPAASNLPEGWTVLAFAGGLPIDEPLRARLSSLGAHEGPGALAVRIVTELEALSASNAGHGAALRLGGKTVECSAYLMDENGRVGFVRALRKTEHPILLADSLARAGGGDVLGQAGDELAEQLGLELGSLIDDESRQRYENDLAQSVQNVDGPQDRALLPLYVKADALSEAIARTVRSPADPFVGKFPVFALVQTEDEKSAFALSTGGRPLARPGADTPWDRASDYLALEEDRASISFATKEPCERSPRENLALMRSTGSLQWTSTVHSGKCPSDRFVLVRGKEWTSNFPTESFLDLGRAPASDKETEPLADSSASPGAPPTTNTAPKPSQSPSPKPAQSPSPKPAQSPGPKVAPSTSTSPPSPAPQPTESTQ